MEIILNEESIVKIFSDVLTLQVATNEQLAQCLISTSGVVNIDKALNSAKTHVIKCYNSFLESFSTIEQQPGDFFQTKFYKFLQVNGVQGVFNSVFLFCKHEAINLENALQVKQLHISCVLIYYIL